MCGGVEGRYNRITVKHLREALLLEVGYDGLAAEHGAADHGQHLVEFALQQRQLEHVLRRIHLSCDGSVMIKIKGPH